MAKPFLCSSTQPVVQTSGGKLRGFFFDGIYTFHGIPYAQAGRFQMPGPAKPWQGVRDALSYGYIAPLLEKPAPQGELLIPHRFWPENEHCQYLNIWSPSLDKGAKKPVMVWLHGGGFEAGSSIEQVAYEGGSLSAFGDVVVVSINHRLNILGFLDLSPYGEKYQNSGNAGMADIVEALRWVRDNIGAFGGDPGNVTVFGQSGGGMKVTALGQIPAAQGLFHKAVVMSGIADLPMGGRRDDRPLVEQLLKELDLTENQVGQLETVPFDQLAAAYHRAKKTIWGGNGFMWGPLPNEWYAGDPLDVGFSDYAKTIPTMAGTVVAEFGAFGPMVPNKHTLSPQERRRIVAARYGEEADRVIAAYQKAYPGKNEVDVLSVDGVFRRPTLRYIEEKAAAASAPVYSYQFALDFDCDDGRPAWHCSDIPFVFHNTALVPVCHIPEVTERLEEQICRAYVNFARCGDPNHETLPQWPAFRPEQKATMVFDRECTVRVDYEAELLGLLKADSPFPAPSPDAGEEDKAWLY